MHLSRTNAVGPTVHRLITITVAMVLLWALSLMHLWVPDKAQAVTIAPSDTGVVQGALVDRPSDYRANVLDATAASGAQWIRLDLWWFRVEETKGTYNWSQFDNLYGGAKAKGLNVLVVVTGAPQWATGCIGVNCPPTKPNIKHWKSFLSAAANRYKTSTYGITTYEIWNEPNITRFYEKPNASTYVNQVLKPAYEAITAAHPNATVLSGGTAPAHTTGGNIAPWEFIKNMYEAGGKNYFHHIAHHPYTQPDPPTGGNASWNAFMQMDTDYPATGVISIRKTMAAYQDSGKKIWATEIGFPTHPAGGTCDTYAWDNNIQRCVTEAVQAERVAQVYNEWAKRDYTGKIFWYAMLNEHPNFVTSTDPEANFGFKRADNTAKPALDPFSKIVSDRYAATVMADGPRHYWKMGELSWTLPMKNEMGPAADGKYISSGILMGTDGTVAGTPAPTFLETANNRAEVYYNSESTRLGGTAWTVEFSARRVGGTLSWPGLMGRGNAAGPDGWLIYVNHAGGGDVVSFKRNNQECQTTTNQLADGKSHHFAVTYANNTVQWYVDGAAVPLYGVCSVAYPTPADYDQTLFIGASPDFPGNNALGHVVIYNKALTPGQVAAHANAAVRLP